MGAVQRAAVQMVVVGGIDRWQWVVRTFQAPGVKVVCYCYCYCYWGWFECCW